MNQNNKYIIGLTGGIATGKSTVANILKKCGFKVIDYDNISREIISKDIDTIELIRQSFGDEFVVDGTINRKKLGEYIFSNTEKREILNDITHNRIIDISIDALNSYDDEIVFMDIPLLFESWKRIEEKGIVFDEVWLVSSDFEVQKARLIERDQISSDYAETKISSQMPLKEKSEKSDIIIDNNGNLEELESKVKHEIQNLQERTNKGMVRSLKKIIKVVLWIVIFIFAAYLLLNMKYPLSYVETIDKYAEEYGVDKYLVYSMINTESGFNKEAQSHKGAKGLMQIMPMTSEEICGNLSEDIESMDMSDPETNIKYGVYYIKQLLDKYEGNVEVALAAYNAGMGNVKNWLESTINIEDFTNSVNINETKNYISKVNNGRDMYKLLYDDLKIQSLFNGDNNIKIMNDIKALLKDVKTKVGQLM